MRNLGTIVALLTLTGLGFAAPFTLAQAQNPPSAAAPPPTELRAGRVVRGEITSTDARSERLPDQYDGARYYYADTYVVNANPGEVVEIEVVKLSGSASGYFLDAPRRPGDDNVFVGERGSRKFNHRVAREGGIRFEVLAASNNLPTQYEVRYSVVDPATVTRTAPPIAELQIGQTVNGVLERSDPRTRWGQPGDVYSFNGRAGQRIELRMHSPNFMPSPELPFGVSDLVNTSALSGDVSHNMRIAFTLPSDGIHRIVATVEFGASGPYTITVLDAGVALADNNAAEQRRDALLREADAALNNGDNQRALDAYNSAGAMGAYSRNMMINMGVAHYRLGNYPLAEQQFQRVLQYDPSNATARANLQATQNAAAALEAQNQRQANAILGAVLGVVQTYADIQAAANAPPAAPSATPSGPLPPLAQGSPRGDGRPDSSRQRLVHNPAQDASSCVQIVVETSRGGADLSGAQRLVNQCGMTVEVFWCFVGGECERNAGNSWTLSASGAGSSWPIGRGQVRYGACRGANSGGFEGGSQGQRALCSYWPEN